MNKALRYFAGIALTTVLSCGGGSSAGDPLAEGWTFFEGFQYPEAHASFTMAAESGLREGYVGLSWVCIEMDSMPQADVYANLVAGDSLIDGYAAWSAVLWARGNYPGSIAKAGFVLRNDPAYVFDHRPTVNFQDMIWYQASAYLHMGNYSQCLSRIQQLDGGFTTDINAVNAGDVLATKLELLATQLIQQ